MLAIEIDDDVLWTAGYSIIDIVASVTLVAERLPVSSSLPQTPLTLFSFVASPLFSLFALSACLSVTLVLGTSRLFFASRRYSTDWLTALLLLTALWAR